MIAEPNWKSKILQKSKAEQPRFNVLNKSNHLQVNKTTYEQGSDHREFTHEVTRKKSKRDQISVDSMISLYILKTSSQPTTDDIGKSDLIKVYQTDFIPSKEINFEMLFELEKFGNKNSFYIMPATYKVLR